MKIPKVPLSIWSTPSLNKVYWQDRQRFFTHRQRSLERQRHYELHQQQAHMLTDILDHVFASRQEEQEEEPVTTIQ